MVAAGAVTVDVVLVVAVTPAVGVWEDERVRTGVSGGDWLPAAVDSGGAFATAEAEAWKTQTESHVPEASLQGLHASRFWGEATEGQEGPANSIPKDAPRSTPSINEGGLLTSETPVNRVRNPGAHGEPGPAPAHKLSVTS